jgi:molybdopterin converting factor small subunit
MARVQFTRHLNRFFPALGEEDVEASRVSELVQGLDRKYPGLAAYLIEDDGSLRKHVNIFVEEVLIRDRRGLSDALARDSKVFIVQALSGG